MKRLYRSDDNKVFAGVCGGLGEYADVDPVLFRVLWVIVTTLTGFFPGIIAYVIMIFVVPSRRKEYTYTDVTAEEKKTEEKKTGDSEEERKSGEQS